MPALTLFLMANPQREIEQRAKVIFELCAAGNLAANVPDDAAEPSAQKLGLAPGVLELVGMRVAPTVAARSADPAGGEITIYLGMPRPDEARFSRFKSVSTPNAAKIIRHGSIGTE